MNASYRFPVTAAGGGPANLPHLPSLRGCAWRQRAMRATLRAMGRVTVVGAGVVGLSCALRLLEAGHRVDVLARELPLETTSAAAAAIWFPYRAWPRERVLDWSRTSYDEF